MKKFWNVVAGAFLIGTVALPASAAFDSGSNGSYGPILVPGGTTLTLQVPPDGIFHATTITLEQHGHLRFIPNELHTPIYLLATGDVILGGQNTSISISGSGASGANPGVGGPGGFNGGHGGVSGGGPSAGMGPGGGSIGTGDTSATCGGGGAFGTVPSNVSANDGSAYGSALLIPMIGGSGGGGAPGIGGGGGGGALVIASNTRIGIAGSISADGGSGSSPCGVSGGSGGSVRLVAPVFSGGSDFTYGVVTVHGANGAGAGRVRVDTTNPVSAMQRISYQPSGALSIGSFMQVFPATNPKLEITSVAGNAVAAGSAASIVLPTGAPTTQNVVLRATNFQGSVPVRVVVTPTSGGGNATTFDGTITVPSGATTATATVAVTLPVNQPVSVHAWTR